MATTETFCIIESSIYIQIMVKSDEENKAEKFPQ